MKKKIVHIPIAGWARVGKSYFRFLRGVCYCEMREAQLSILVNIGGVFFFFFWGGGAGDKYFLP